MKTIIVMLSLLFVVAATDNKQQEFIYEVVIGVKHYKHTLQA